MSANDLGTFCFSEQSRKKQNVPCHQRGFILLPVVVAITLLAAMALMLSYQGASQTGVAAGELEHDRLRYIAAAGMAHAKLQLAQNTSCSGYSDIPKTDFAGESYSVDFADQEGSPVEVKAIGELQGGAKFKLERDSVRAYQAPIAVVLQLSKTGGKDTILDDGYPIRNYGGSSYLRVSSGGWQTRPLLEFDLSSIPSSAKILSARLELLQQSINNSGAVAVHRMTRDWLEGTRNGGGIADGATWETHDGIAAWTQPGGEFDSTVYGVTQVSSADSGGWVAWDIGGLVQDWVSGKVPNYGLLLAGDGNVTNANYASKDTNNPDQAPKLTIVYACECGVGGSSSTLVLQPGLAGKEAMLRGTKNYGAVPYAWIDTNVPYHALYEFDLSGLAPEAIVTSALLDIHQSSADVVTTAADLDVHRVTTAWVEGTGGTSGLSPADGVTWSTSDGTTSWNSAGGDYDSNVIDSAMVNSTTSTWHQWNVKSLVQSWVDGTYPNYGFLLRASSGNLEKLYLDTGDHNDPAVHPKLTITYSCPCGTICLTPGTEPPGYNVLLIVGNDTTLSSKDVGYKVLMESWGHTVAVIDDGASQADYDTAMDAADVIYASGSALGANILDKATYTTKGLVNEVNGKIDNFGFSSSTSATATFDTLSSTNASHYITEPFSGNLVTVFTSSLTNPVPGGTLAPDLQNVGQVSTTLVLGTLDAGATRYDSTPSQGRRVHLPFTSAETTDMTADGKIIMQRAIEWGAGGGGSSQQQILLVVADATNLSAQDIARQTLMADWGYQVETISASDSQANFNAAVATASAAYVVMQNSSTALGTKLRDATIAVINEEVELRAEIGFAANRDWPTTRDNVDIIVDSHYITLPFATGLLTIATSPIEVVTLSGQMAGGLLVLGQQDWGGLQNSLSVIDTGGALYGGGNAAGRRVQLPWGRVGFDINNLNADGLTIMRRAIEWGIAGGGGGGGGGGSGATVTLLPTQDTFVGGNSTAVYGGNVSLFMGFGSREWRPVLQFDVSGIPAGSTVTSAKLRLHNWDDSSASAGPLTVTAYGVEQAWTETWGNKGANWYDRAKQGGGALQWSTPGVSYSTGDSAIATFDSTAAPQWVEWEVAPLVQGWIDGASTNNGIVLVPDAGSAWANSRSADYGDAALHPQLVVTYE